MTLHAPYCDQCKTVMVLRSAKGLKRMVDRDGDLIELDVPERFNAWRCDTCPDFAFDNETCDDIEVALSSSPFRPDWASPPGDTIKDVLVGREMSTEDLAVQLGLSDAGLKKMLKGKLPITDDIAENLARIFYTSKSFWVRREFLYREALERIACKKG